MYSVMRPKCSLIIGSLCIFNYAHSEYILIIIGPHSLCAISTHISSSCNDRCGQRAAICGLFTQPTIACGWTQMIMAESRQTVSNHDHLPVLNYRSQMAVATMSCHCIVWARQQLFAHTCHPSNRSLQNFNTVV